MLRKPTQPLVDARGHLLTCIKAIVEGAEKSKKEHQITYRVAGGPPTRRLAYTLEISGTGSVTCHIVDQLKEHRMRTFKSSFSADKVIQIFQELLESRLLENVDTGGGFLPDSLVGSITVEDGISRITYYFLADEQQRRNQGFELNPSLAKMYGLLEQLTIQVMRKEGMEGSKRKTDKFEEGKNHGMAE
jgi:hypothetical protein